MNTKPNPLAAPLTLPCGAVLKNRIVKSAMSEIMGDRGHGPTPELHRLYSRWARGGTGLLVTGNVMVDRRALGEPNNVVIEDDRHMEALSRWAECGKANGAHIWVQLNHPGRQSPAFLSPEPVAPSAIPYASDLKRAFNTPRSLTDAEILEIIHRFAKAAETVKRAGFTGVQIHGAHGYLVSQFLSPLYNHRTDRWGGDITGRMRFVLETYRAIRREVGPEFPVGIKINSSDFKKNGFTEEEALVVIRALDAEGIDLVEVSGGNYEAPAMMGGRKKEGTPYFLAFADQAARTVTAPLVLTGGFRSDEMMRTALCETAVAMVGLARPLVVDPELPGKVLNGNTVTSTVRPLTTGVKLLDRITMLEITWYENQLRYLGMGQEPRPHENVYKTVWKILSGMGTMAFKRRRA
ncbi:NADH:flavin oxidoreductase/NADH oxidase family protein [Desulfoluna butyratoxydans]|uniref:Nadh:flavin oxidoreductase/nadh oxidase n-terminal n=1 Tax=Desulfoluna butyratoxydans TaxID=231438 RepID=A0A4U8YJ02_9BACT|nr:NADH:flavin oxidoreductase/NADH oxidase family protein [Desulfoluna butyratoxydans]VFQ43327.1 nadh:flavin oxidoreductase/nadh oxidase n-terminal [Desulfoluna butyratoxydans]